MMPGTDSSDLRLWGKIHCLPRSDWYVCLLHEVFFFFLTGLKYAYSLHLCHFYFHGLLITELLFCSCSALVGLLPWCLFLNNNKIFKVHFFRKINGLWNFPVSGLNVVLQLSFSTRSCPHPESMKKKNIWNVFNQKISPVRPLLAWNVYNCLSGSNGFLNLTDKLVA